MAALKLLGDILLAAVWLIVLIISVIIGSPIAFVIWFIKREQRFMYYWEGTIQAIVRVFFPSFGL